MEEKLVYSSTNALEVNYVCSILKENNIVFLKKTEGAGDYLNIAAGNLFSYATKIYVNENDFEKAAQLINTINSVNENPQETEIPEELKDISKDEENEIDKKASTTSKFLKFFILFFIFCPILIIIAAMIISISLQN